MKRHVQETGVRQWSGDDLLELQREPLGALELFFAQYGPCVIQGCETQANPDGTYRLREGFVAIPALDPDGAERLMVMPCHGAESVPADFYLSAEVETVEELYGDGLSKPITRIYSAVPSAQQPVEGVPFYQLNAAKIERFVDVVQDSEHRFFTDQDRRANEQALETLQDNIDALRVGSVNLLQNSGFTDGKNHWSMNMPDTEGEVIDCADSPSGHALVIHSTTAHDGYFQRSSSSAMEVGKTYTIGLYAKADREGMILHTGPKENPAQFPLSSDYQWLTHTFSCSASTSFYLVSGDETPGDIFVHSPMLVEGTKTAGWTPSYAEIKAGRQHLINDLKDYTNEVAEETLEAANRYTNNRETEIMAELSAADLALQGAIDTLRVGSVNLLQNSGFTQGKTHWQNNISIISEVVDCEQSPSGKGLTLHSGQKHEGVFQYAQQTGMTQGKVYTIGIYAKADTDGMSLKLGNTTNMEEFPLSDDFQWITYTFTCGTSSALVILSGNDVAGDITVYSPMLVEGTKVGDWTPSYQEINADREQLIEEIGKKADKATTLGGYGITNGFRVLDPLTEEDLNIMTHAGYIGLFNASGANTVKNKPGGVDAFGMFVIKSASAWFTQLLYSTNVNPGWYSRHYNASTMQWTAWSHVWTSENFSTSGTYASMTVGTLQNKNGGAKVSIWTGTQAQYDAITRDANTLYFVTL